MQRGLGAAAQTRFCHTELGLPTTTVELNPQVIAAYLGRARAEATHA